MANKQLFQSQPGRLPPATNARNEAVARLTRFPPRPRWRSTPPPVA